MLEYYGRMLFTLNLLPLLRTSPSPRVLTVLGGSFLSNKLILDDLDLEKPGNFGGLRTQTHLSIMNTLFLDRLAADTLNSDVTFVHNWPGAVDTGNLARYHERSILSPLPLTSLIKPVLWVISAGKKEAGERHVYVATTGKLGGNGPKDGTAEKGTGGSEGKGLFLVNHKCEVVDKGDILGELRKTAQEKVWDKTMGVLRPFI